MKIEKVKLRGVSHNQCGGCGLVFSSDSGFEKHRTGNYYNPETKTKGTRRCLSQEEILSLTKSKNNQDKLFVLVPAGEDTEYSYIKGAPMPEEVLLKRTGKKAQQK